MDERPLSELLGEAVPEGTRERTSREMGEHGNAIFRCIVREPIPGPDKWPGIAELLGLTL